MKATSWMSLWQRSVGLRKPPLFLTFAGDNELPRDRWLPLTEGSFYYALALLLCFRSFNPHISLKQEITLKKKRFNCQQMYICKIWGTPVWLFFPPQCIYQRKTKIAFSRSLLYAGFYTRPVLSCEFPPSGSSHNSSVNRNYFHFIDEEIEVQRISVTLPEAMCL